MSPHCHIPTGTCHVPHTLIMSPQGLCHILMGNPPCALMDSAIPIPTGTPPCPYSHVPTQSQPHRDCLTLLQGPRCAPHILLPCPCENPVKSLGCQTPTGTPTRPHTDSVMSPQGPHHVPTGPLPCPTLILGMAPQGPHCAPYMLLLHPQMGGTDPATTPEGPCLVPRLSHPHRDLLCPLTDSATSLSTQGPHHIPTQIV